MDVKRGIVIVSFGDRDEYIRSIVHNISKYSDLPILLYTERERSVAGISQKIIKKQHMFWMYSSRWGIRNCNFWSAHAALNTFDSCCVLNDDMRIVHSGFVDGFDLAERFGVCVPMNPRIYVKHNAMGADAKDEDFRSPDDGPEHAPACNMSPMFCCRNVNNARVLLLAYTDELLTCMRGTLAFWKASWKTGITPVYLPEFWCVGAGNARYIKDYRKILRGSTYQIEPMMLHWGQQGVREVFGDIT